MRVLIQDDDQYDKHNAAFGRSVGKLLHDGENAIMQRDGIDGTAITRMGRKVDVVLAVSGIHYHGNVEFVATIREKRKSATGQTSDRKWPPPVDLQAIDQWIPPRIKKK